MATDTHADMHRDHHTWQSELAMWRDDIEIWKNEYEAATDQALLDPTLQKYGRVIREHAKIVRQHEESLAAHERAVAEFERAGRGDELQLLALAKAHPKEAITHAQLREAHEHVKKQHNAVMAEWSLLHKPPGDLSSQASTKGRM